MIHFGMFYVGIDLGTYLCRFILAKEDKNSDLGFKVVDYSTYVVNFGNVRPGMSFSKSSTIRLETAFRSFKKMIKPEYNISCVGTAALRFCEDAPDIVDQIYKKFKINIEIIQPSKEIYLSALGCSGLIEKEAIVFDVGSGSTEVALIRKNKYGIQVKECAFLNLGLANNLVSAKQRAQEFAKLDTLKEYAKKVPIISAKCNTLKVSYNCCSDKFKKDVHGVVLPMVDIKKVLSKVCKMKSEELKKLACIGVNRVSLVKLGLPWIFKVLEYLDAKKIVLSEYGLKEGVIMDMVYEKKRSSSVG